MVVLVWHACGQHHPILKTLSLCATPFSNSQNLCNPSADVSEHLHLAHFFTVEYGEEMLLRQQVYRIYEYSYILRAQSSECGERRVWERSESGEREGSAGRVWERDERVIGVGRGVGVGEESERGE